MGERLSERGNFWLHLDHPCNPMVVTGLIETVEPMSISELRRIIEKRLLIFNQFRKKLIKPSFTSQRFNWHIDPHFDIHSHVKRIALPKPGNKQSLQQVINHHISTPMDKSKPLWDILLIEQYNNGSAIIARFHLCIIGSVDFVRVLLSMSDDIYERLNNQTVANQSKGLSILPFPSIFEQGLTVVNKTKELGLSCLKIFFNSISNPFYIIEIMRTSFGLSVEAAIELSRLILLPVDSHTIFKGSPGVQKHVAWSEPIPLKRIKTVAYGASATVNVLLLTAMTGALKKYLLSRNSPIDYRELRVAIPVDVRPHGIDPNKRSRFGVVLLDLPVHVEDPFVRLLEIKRRMSDMEQSPDVISIVHTLNSFGLSPKMIAQWIALHIPEKISAILSNAQGPDHEVLFGGKTIRRIMFWLPRTGRLTLGTTFCSYNGMISLGVAADAEQIPDPENIIKQFNQQIDDILEKIPQTIMNKNIMNRTSDNSLPDKKHDD